MSIKDFAEELNTLIENNKKKDKQLELYKLQLIVILLNSNGKIKDLDYPDLTNIDLDKIRIGVGMSSCSLYLNIEGEKPLITSWEELPIKNN
jgi:hypothetical protein